MKKTAIFFVICIACFLFMSCSNSNVSETAAAAKMEGDGYASAEKAAEAYLQAFKAANLSGMLSAFALETYVDNYDLEAQLARLKAYSLSSDPSLPASNDFTRDLNFHQRTGNVTAAIRFQYLTIFTSDLKALDGITMSLTSDDDISRLAMQLGNPAYLESLQGMELGEFLPPENLNEHYLSEQNRLNMQKIASICGADEMKSVAVPATIDEQEYLFCFDAVRYGSQWYLSSLSGNIGALLNIPTFSGGVFLR